MSISGAALSPREGASPPRGLAELRSRSDPGLVGALLAGDPPAVRAALAGATLLLPAAPVAEGQAIPLSGRGTTGRPLVWAFTDIEALGAWDRRRPEAVIELGLSGLAGSSEAPDTIIALNAAGPGAFLVETEALPVASGDTPAPMSLEERNSLIDPKARSPIRRRARDAHEQGRRAVGAGADAEARAYFERAIAASGELGDRLHGAASGLELGKCLARMGTVDAALAALERAAEVLAAFGDGDLAIAALLDAALLAREQRLSDDAERLSVLALELAAGSDFADRLVSVWRRLDGR